MAPFRGNRGGFRGRGGNRGGRGVSRGGRGASRGSRGGSDKLARSGIRTRAGYRKFDSQRVKDVESDEEKDRAQEVEEEVEGDDIDLSEDEEVVPAVKSYNALLQSFQQPAEEDGRKRKRRKVEVREEVISVDEDGVSDQDAGLEVDNEAEEGQDEVDDERADGAATQLEDEDEEDQSDPFEAHFASPDDNELQRRLKAIQAGEWRTEKQLMPKLGAIKVSIPQCVEGNILRKPNLKSTADIALKHRLVGPAEKHIGSLDNLQQTIAPYIGTYSDLLLGNRTPSNASSLRNLACLHALNHVLKGRDKVIKNNVRLAHDETLSIQDQGFTRPKVLILVETRQMCAKYADAIIALFDPGQQEDRKRFTDSFSSPTEDDSRSTMPPDYRELFDGNSDNNFLTTMKLTRRTLKYYSPFYTSDIILASPLGLRRILDNPEPKKRDHDFLSSIEVVIVDQADAMQMQNWTNVETTFSHLNLQLKETHGCDFSRVRPWYLDGNARFLRQTIVFSAYITPEMNRLLSSSMLNVAGKAKVMHSYPDGAITSTSGMGIKQTFSRFISTSPADDPDARFKYFTTAVLPALVRLPKPADGARGILVFVPSYFDFLRVRNFFATSALTQDISFGAIHEYSDVSAQRRARSHFLSGRYGVLLYTQRAHHFFRLRLRGVKRVVCYGVPDNAIFYEEVVGGYLGTSLQEGKLSTEESGVRVLFSKWDGLALERVVGSGRVKGMLGGMGDRFEFV